MFFLYVKTDNSPETNHHNYTEQCFLIIILKINDYYLIIGNENINSICHEHKNGIITEEDS